MVKKQETEVAVTNLESTAVANPDAFNAFESYGNSVSNRNIVGRLLKFSKGDYLCGEDQEELPEGTRLVANMGTLAIGWIKWVDGKPDQQVMGLLVEGFKPPKRSELDDTNEEDWEVDEQSGQPRDPWQFSNYMVLKDPGKPATDEFLYTFATSSRGGLGAIGELCKVYGKAIRTKPDELPVVALNVTAYDHPNKKFGRIKVPVFEVVDWEPKGVGEGEVKPKGRTRKAA